MLHLIYLMAFTVLALLAISNLLKSLVTLSIESQRQPRSFDKYSRPQAFRGDTFPRHPELLDTSGNPINEPLLVMRSMNLEDARQQLDALYHSSPSPNNDSPEET